MILFPAIDLYEKKAVRLLRGDYAKMTVYSPDPPSVAQDFVSCGAGHIHIVDLEGARNGDTPNFDTVCAIKERSGAFCEVGGGIRSMEAVERYLSAGLDRVILGTAAVRDPAFLRRCVEKYPRQIAVGVDIRDGAVAIRGWTESSGLDAFAFCLDMQAMGVNTLICTDISRDGAMGGANRALYERLTKELRMCITASGGVSTLSDVEYLASLGLYGAIIGKAYYTGDIDLRAALEAAK